MSAYSEKMFEIFASKPKPKVMKPTTPYKIERYSSEKVLYEISNVDLITKGWCVYLMQANNMFRIGQCVIYNKDNRLGILDRLYANKADKVWILQCFSDYQEALVYESIIAYKYGIPQTLFNPKGRVSKIKSQAIFEGVGDRTIHATKCLNDHNCEIDKPTARAIYS